jgi:hypothetical protein
MEKQLVLVEPLKESWRLDPRTREMGRKGVEAARQALREASTHVAA